MNRFAALLGLLLAGCVSDTGSLEIPLFRQESPLVPVEGLESPDLAHRAQGAVLSARGERPIQVLALPSLQHRQHPVRGDVLALAGPASGGRFVYVAQEEERDARLRLASIDGADRPVARLTRPVHALSLAPDGGRAALLAPFPERDERSRGGVLRELLVADLARGTVEETGVTCWPWPPAWIDAQRLAIVTVAEGGAREVRVLDLATRRAGAPLAPGEAVLAEPGGAALLAATRDELGRVHVARVPLDGAAAQELPVRGVLAPLAVLPDGLLASYAAPTLGAERGWELGILDPTVPMGTIKLHDLASGAFTTVEPRASPRRLWSAGGP